jgi:hypothetical protein
MFITAAVRAVLLMPALQVLTISRSTAVDEWARSLAGTGVSPAAGGPPRKLELI